jgi:uncharacterized protein (DUF433 family)
MLIMDEEISDNSRDIIGILGDRTSYEEICEEYGISHAEITPYLEYVKEVERF